MPEAVPADRLFPKGVAAVASLMLAACANGTARLPPPEPRAIPAGVLQVRWRDKLEPPQMFEQTREECATGAVAGSRFVIGNRRGRIFGIDRATGRVLWTTSASGGVDASARFDERRGQVYVGSDDGAFVALDPQTGAVRWTFRAEGAIERAPEMDERAVYLTTAADKAYALDAKTGKQLWMYEREPPDGFTIHGYAGPRLAGGVLYTGFTDGYLVALKADTGELIWAHSLAGSSDQFVDVDTTPAVTGGLVIAASYSGGMAAVDATDGTPRWKFAVDGAGTPVVASDGDEPKVYFAAPRAGVHALDAATGTLHWRQGLADAGDLTAPQVGGPYLLFSGSRAGTFVVDRRDGRLLQLFDPGGGVCASPALDPRHESVYVLANSGTLYALSLLPP